MKTKKVRTILDKQFGTEIIAQRMAYSLKKKRNWSTWTVEIGKFNAITDPYIQGEITEHYFQDDKKAIPDLKKQFRKILDKAIEDKKVNYEKVVK